MLRIFRWSSVLSRCHPMTVASPAVFEMRQQSILTVVVLPAPFGPRNPKTSPASMLRVRFWTAVLLPNRFVESLDFYDRRHANHRRSG